MYTTRSALADAKEKARAIKRVTNLFLTRKLDKLEEFTDEEAFVFLQAPKSLPYAGRYTGKQCVRNALNKFQQSFKIVSVPEARFLSVHIAQPAAVSLVC